MRGPGYVPSYDRYDGPGTGNFHADAMSIVVPQKPAPGKPWVFHPSFLERDSVAWLLERYEWFLAQVAADPERAVGSVWLVPPAQRRLLSAWNATAAPVPRGCVHQVVGERAAQDPERLAVADAEGAWSYGELEPHLGGRPQADRLDAESERSLRLVHVLRELRLRVVGGQGGGGQRLLKNGGMRVELLRRRAGVGCGAMQPQSTERCGDELADELLEIRRQGAVHRELDRGLAALGSGLEARIQGGHGGHRLRPTRPGLIEGVPEGRELLTHAGCVLGVDHEPEPPLRRDGLHAFH